MAKTSSGNFFEDFRLGQSITHATPRTVTAGFNVLYTALYGTRFAVQSSDAFAASIGYQRAPIDDLLVFHVVFGKTVPDVSLNAVANLGYADGRFLGLVYPGDTLHARSEVIGLKETSNGQTGIVWVRSRGFKADGSPVLDYARWVLVRKRDLARRFLKSYVEAIHLVKTNPDISKRAFAKYRQTKDEKRIDDAYQALRETVRPKPYPSIEGFKTIIEDASERIPAAKTANPKDFMDVSLLEELDKSGFIDALYR